MAINLSYNQEEAIFLGLFFGLLIITFIFIFSYPSNSVIDYHTKNIMSLIKPATSTKLKSKVKPLPKIKKPNVMETPL
jgi:hypothetical protein